MKNKFWEFYRSFTLLPTLTVFLFFCLLPAAKIYSIVTVAFGAIKNESDRVRLNEFELRLPVEVSRLLKDREKEIKIIPPQESIKIFEQKKLPNNIIYSKEEELVQACGALKANAILTATINLRDDNQIQIKQWLYLCEGNRQFKFVYIEPPATALKSAVLGTVAVIGQYLPEKSGGRLLLSEVKPGSKVAILSNTSPEALNRAAIALFERGYKVSAIGYVDFLSPEEKELNLFQEISSQELSYVGFEADFSDLGSITLHPLENATKKVTQQTALYDLFVSYTRSFDTKETAALQRLRNLTQADFLLIAHNGQTASFARVIDLRNGKLSYLRQQLPASQKTDDPENTNLLQLVAEISIPPQLPDVSNVGGLSTLAKIAGGDDIATVAILDFFNRSGQKKFAWLTTSLSAAVSESMLRVFEYRRADLQKEKEATAKFGANIQTQTFLELQKMTGADFLIFGDYTFDPKTKELLIEAKVYDLFSQKEIGTATERTPIDNRIFNAVDNIANKIVQDIYKMATTQ